MRDILDTLSDLLFYLDISCGESKLVPPMKHLFLTFAAVLVLLPGLAKAEEPPDHPVKPLLWKVEGGKLSKPSYLFGTIHLGSGALAKLHPAAEKAFDSADVLYTEIPMDAATQLMLAEKCVRDDNQTLSQSIGEDLSKQLDAELKSINPQLDSKPFQQMKTWVVFVSVPMLESQLKGEKAMDSTLWKRAAAANKSTSSIETAKSQVAVFESFTEAEQSVLLAETLRVMKEERLAGKSGNKDLVDLYVSGNPEKLKKEMDKQIEEMCVGPHQELGKRFYSKLLTDRDLSMANTIAKLLAGQPDKIHFFAAGAGHYIGKPSIRSHLEKLGFSVTRIEN